MPLSKKDRKKERKKNKKLRAKGLAIDCDLQIVPAAEAPAAEPSHASTAPADLPSQLTADQTLLEGTVPAADQPLLEGTVPAADQPLLEGTVPADEEPLLEGTVPSESEGTACC